MYEYRYMSTDTFKTVISNTRTVLSKCQYSIYYSNEISMIFECFIGYMFDRPNCVFRALIKLYIKRNQHNYWYKKIRKNIQTTRPLKKKDCADVDNEKVIYQCCVA
jgi:hypothetical protein